MRRRSIVALAACLTVVFCLLGALYGASRGPFCLGCLSSLNVHEFTYWYSWKGQPYAAWRRLWECSRCKKLWKASEPWNRDDYVWDGTKYKAVNEVETNPLSNALGEWDNNPRDQKQ